MNDRAVSEVLGSMLIFALIISLLGILQITAVPQQNADVEFKHSQVVRDEMVDLRTAIMDAASNGGERTRAVTLGVDYPSRFFLINPPPSSGTLQTTTPGDIEFGESDDFGVEDACGVASGIDSRSLVYQADYNALQSAPEIGFEHGFTYQRYGDGLRIDDRQVLVDGTTITLVPFRDDVSENGVGRTSVDVASQGMGVTTSSELDDGFTLTVPSRLSASEWENNEKLLANEMTGDGGNPRVSDVTDAGDGRITIHFNSASYTVKCALVGIDKAPPADLPSLPSTGGDDINPTSESGSLVLLDASVDENDDSRVVMDFENTGSPKTVTDSRVNFFFASKPGASNTAKSAKIMVPSEGDLMVVGGEFEEISEGIEFTGSDEQSIKIAFYGDESPEGDDDKFSPPNTDSLFVLTLRFDDGSTSTYFVEYAGSDGGNNNNNNNDNSNNNN